MSVNLLCIRTPSLSFNKLPFGTDELVKALAGYEKLRAQMALKSAVMSVDVKALIGLGSP